MHWVNFLDVVVGSHAGQKSQLLDEDHDALLPSIVNNDKDTIRAIAHRFSSSSRSVRAIKLGAVFSDLENASNDSNYLLGERDAEKLTSTIAATKAAISAMHTSY